MQKIGWIGVGIMGGAMARNLMKAGYEVHIYARRPEKAADLAADGAVFHGSIAECVKASEVVITMVGFPQDVEEVYFAPGNILDSAARGSIVIDMTTTSPTLARRISQEGAKRGLRVLDAPLPEVTAVPEPERCPFWQAAARRILTTACPFFRPWVPTSPISARQAAASTPRWPIRS